MSQENAGNVRENAHHARAHVPPLSGRWSPPSTRCHLDSPAWAEAVLAHILGRCVEEGECLIWPGNRTKRDSRPVVKMAGQELSARRVVWEASRGGEMRRGYYPRMSCGNLLCLKPEHIVNKTRAQYMRESAEAGLCSKPVAVAKRTLGRRKRDDVKLGMDKARQIRERRQQGARTEELAAEFGVCKSAILRIVAGTMYREALVPQASVFHYAEAA